MAIAPTFLVVSDSIGDVKAQLSAHFKITELAGGAIIVSGNGLTSNHLNVLLSVVRSPTFFTEVAVGDIHRAG